MQTVHGAQCAVAATAELISAKWTAVIVHDLSEGPRRFTQLEHDGFVSRRSFPESPPRVEYELTEKGKGLLPIIDAMRKFGRSWLLAAPARGRRRAVAAG